MRDTRKSPKRSRTRELLPLAYGLVAVIAMILLLTWGALQMQITLAGFLNGESFWSKSQKQAVIDLLAYASSGDPSDLQGFRDNFTVLKVDVAARTAINSGHYDKARVAEYFRRGGVIPQAVPGIIFIMDHFPSAPYVAQAMAAWYSVGPSVKALDGMADRLQHAYQGRGLSPAEVAMARQHILALNAYIQPRADRFSLEIAKGAAWVGQVFFLGVFLAAALALLLWLRMARRALQRIRRSDERYRLLFDSAVDGIVMVDTGSGLVLDANNTAAKWLGREAGELAGHPYADLFENCVLREDLSGHGELRGADGGARSVEMRGSIAQSDDRRQVGQSIIRDVSARMRSQRFRRTAVKALASIAEGVIVADAERRIVGLNAAATRISGHTKDDLFGTRFDATRSMPDGSPLPSAIWDEVATTHHWTGEIRSGRSDGSVYSELLSISTIRDRQQRVENYVAVFSDISDAKADRLHLEHLATHDPLTDLVNRAEFQRHCQAAIKRAARERTAVSVLFIDLDTFKFVNDSYSHAVGDGLLQQVAERIRGQLGDKEVIGRIGGDEFTVLLSGRALREDAARPANRLLMALAEPFHVEGYEITLSASIGIAGFPLDGDDAQTLLANADAAMYVAKTEERNTWRFYLPTMQADSRQKILLANELRQALLNDEFRLVYQPVVDLASGRIIAAEALLRWQHPERGEMVPDQFMGVAERIGLAHHIDEWVLHTVCVQVRAWDESRMPPIRVAVNVSAYWLCRPHSVESVRRALQVNGVEPERIVLEITEGAMLRLGDDTQRTMQALHALGIGVAVDDFGTGYASMAYLKLPGVAYLKIDRSFIAGLPEDGNDAAITTAIIAMADSLELTIIAEGVENEAQHQFLARVGCKAGQGFLYSYPLPAATLERRLRPKQLPERTALRLVRPGNE